MDTIAHTPTGFGDIKPSTENQWFVMSFVLIGVTITTMVMEIIGTMYLEELHFIGRQIREKNPWTVIRRARIERRRRETANMLVGLAQFMAMKPQPKPKRKTKKKKAKAVKKISFGEFVASVIGDVAASEKAIGRLMFSKSAPDTPGECQVFSTSAHTIRLVWNPPFPQVGLTTYTVTCRLKSTDVDGTGKSILERAQRGGDSVSPARRYRLGVNRVEPEPVMIVHGIVGCSFEVTQLESCSLYELTVTACNRFGQSKPRKLMEYTGAWR